MTSSSVLRTWAFCCNQENLVFAEIWSVLFVWTFPWIKHCRIVVYIFFKCEGDINSCWVYSPQALQRKANTYLDWMFILGGRHFSVFTDFKDLLLCDSGAADIYISVFNLSHLRFFCSISSGVEDINVYRGVCRAEMSWNSCRLFLHRNSVLEFSRFNVEESDISSVTIFH